MLHVSKVSHKRSKVEMVLSEGWKDREISGNKAGNTLRLEVEEDVTNVLYVHGLLVCPLFPHIYLFIYLNIFIQGRHNYVKYCFSMRPC